LFDTYAFFGGDHVTKGLPGRYGPLVQTRRGRETGKGKKKIYNAKGDICRRGTR